jgi:hypothetical protein
MNGVSEGQGSCQQALQEKSREIGDFRKGKGPTRAGLSSTEVTAVRSLTSKPTALKRDLEPEP